MQHLPLQRLACGRALLAAQLVLERTAEDAEQDFLGGLVALHQRQLHRFVEIGGQRQEARPQLRLPRAELLDVEQFRSEEHTSELQSLMRISYAVFFLKKKKRSLEGQ